MNVIFCREKVVKKINKGEKITVKAGVEFSSLKDALEVDWTSEKYSTMLKRLDSTYFLIRSEYKRTYEPLDTITK